MADSPAPHADPDTRPGVGRLAAGIALFVVPGIALAAFVWETLNELIAGHLRPVRLLVTLPVLAALLWLWRILGRTVQRWDAVRHPVPGPRRIP